MFGLGGTGFQQMPSVMPPVGQGPGVGGAPMMQAQPVRPPAPMPQSPVMAQPSPMMQRPVMSTGSSPVANPMAAQLTRALGPPQRPVAY